MRKIGEETLPRKTFKSDLPCRKKRDTPKKMWLYGLIEEFKKNEHPRNPMENREEWRLRILKM